jgi:hypothetical protein
MQKITIEVEDKLYEVANTLRRSYYQNDMKDLVGSKHPMMWIRMAEAAIDKFNELNRLAAARPRTWATEEKEES